MVGKDDGNEATYRAVGVDSTGQLEEASLGDGEGGSKIMGTRRTEKQGGRRARSRLGGGEEGVGVLARDGAEGQFRERELVMGFREEGGSVEGGWRGGLEALTVVAAAAASRR